MNISYSQASTDQNGTVYIGNFEYNTLNGNNAQTTLNRIYNDEGYVENLASPNFYYYRKDHLGDNREVWLANTNTTVQRTQYYPSGLPWASNTGDNPGFQLRKYNGKEFVEMHGYDTYDIVWRQYYPAIMRFQTQDPFAEKYYSLSPYTMCADNMVRYTDPDGRQIPIDIPFTAATETPIGAIFTLAYVGYQLEPYAFAAYLYGVAKVVEKVQNTTNNQSASQTSQTKANHDKPTVKVDEFAKSKPGKAGEVKGAEHKAGARTSTKNNHQEGQTRKQQKNRDKKRQKDDWKPRK